MRILFTILSAFFLVSFQAAEACCDHDDAIHAHVEKAAEQVVRHSVQHSDQHHHNGPCDCTCHQTQQDQKSSIPSSRAEIETQPAPVLSSWNRLPDFSIAKSTAPPVAENISLPPPTAAQLCSQHCRFLL